VRPGKVVERGPLSASPLKTHLALRAPRARRRGGLEVLGDLRQLVGQGVEHPGEPLLGIAHYADLRIQAHQQVVSSQTLRTARKTPYRASQPEVEIAEGDPMPEI
jgi:hypothetical protein